MTRVNGERGRAETMPPVAGQNPARNDNYLTKADPACFSAVRHLNHRQEFVYSLERAIEGWRETTGGDYGHGDGKPQWRWQSGFLGSRFAGTQRRRAHLAL